MEVTHQQIKDILKTLPIGFYAKRSINVELGTDDRAYFEPMSDKIHIGSDIIIKTLAPLSDTDYNLESAIRTLLYHETSHAMLTPQGMSITNIVNVFEDERIETILADFYHNVDFKDFVKKVNKFDEHTLPKTPFEEFYNTVRFRCGRQIFLDKVNHIIAKYAHLNFFSKYWEHYDYVKEIDELYKLIEDTWHLSEANDFEIPSDLKDNMHLDKFEAPSVDSSEIISKAFDYLCDNNVITDVSSIFAQYKHQTKHNGSAINAYSGVFNPRSVVRDDYKYFVQQNRVGHVKAFSKVQLNLFIDCSGSFDGNTRTVNKILYALKKFEKQNHDFSFTLTTMSVGERRHEKEDRVLRCCGGNRLDEDIWRLYKEVQLPEAQNINIVLFDGDALSDCHNWRDEEKCQKNFKAFDHPNVVLISDNSNRDYIDKYVKIAKVIYTRDYVVELYKTVISSLYQLIK